MYSKRLGCRLCCCSNFNYTKSDKKSICVCKHGDVWHRTKYSFFYSKISLDHKLKNSCKKILGSVFSNYNIDTSCHRCNAHIKEYVVLNCKHVFCKECSLHIVVVCPICIKYVTDKVKIVVI